MIMSRVWFSDPARDSQGLEPAREPGERVLIGGRMVGRVEEEALADARGAELGQERIPFLRAAAERFLVVAITHPHEAVAEVVQVRAVTEPASRAPVAIGWVAGAAIGLGIGLGIATLVRRKTTDTA